METLKTKVDKSLQINNTNVDYNTDFDFDGTKNYNPGNNYQLAELCSLVYQEDAIIKSQIEKWNNHDKHLNLKLDIFNKDSFRFMVLSNQNFVILIFRGTVNLENWLTDFDTKQVPFKKGRGKVHQGFYDSILELEPYINNIITKRCTENQDLYITGHSLGGAQATIAAMQCESLKSFTNITTFGEPKIGNAEFINFVNGSLNSDIPSGKSRLFRQVNQYDPVPYVPFFSYYHEGGFYIYSNFYNQLYQIEITPKASSIDEYLNTIPNEEAMFKFNINNHSMSVYLEKAKKNIDDWIFND